MYYNSQEVSSGHFAIDGIRLVVDAYSDNYDGQGDKADLQIQIADESEATPMPGMTISLYHGNGTFFSQYCNTCSMKSAKSKSTKKLRNSFNILTFSNKSSRWR